MPFIKDKYVNPFYQEVSSDVQNELNTRADYYGRKVRGIGKAFPRNVAWSYQKVAYGRVRGESGIVLGTAWTDVMSDRKGNLTLYNAQRNVPNKPLLTGIELSNEGTIGSLLKGKFTFVFYPKLSSAGFSFENMEKDFFTPGKEIEITFGWSVYAASANACKIEFKGIVYNFNWNFNTDLSVTADVSIVSKASIAMGASGDQSVKKEDGVEEKPDPLGIAIDGNNLANVIKSDLAALTESTKIAQGASKYIDKNSTKNKLLEYFAIGLPFSEEGETETKKPPPKKEPTPKVFWYVKLGSIVEFANDLIRRFEQSSNNAALGNLYTIQAFKNISDKIPDIQSAFPIDVFFPDSKMGDYGAKCVPFGIPSIISQEVDEDQINIGNILLGTDYVIETYTGFIENNSTNIPFKNITSLFESLIKRINFASGDMYQLNTVMYEPFSEKPADAGVKAEKAILSIEDSNISKSVKVIPYKFTADIYKPLIKNVSITCKPPGPLATAAYVQARGNKDNKVKPNNTDVSTATKKEKDEAEFIKEYQDAQDGLKKAKEKIGSSAGFNNSWGEQFRGNLIKYKRNKLDNATWLTKAVYPIDLSITVDGISGFKFGDVIETTLIPAHYNTTYNMVFTVVKVNHSVKDGVWETTLTTKSRISMDK